MPTKQNDFYTVSELNEFIRDVIQAGFPQAVWVCGEIQGLDRQKTKNHIFFQLLEKDAQTKDAKAVIDLVIWASKKPMLQQLLQASEAAFELKDGIEVKFLCTVDFYPPHGRVRLAVENIDPFYTLGKLAQEKQKLIAELQKAGILDKNKALELPIVPLNIGLITSLDSAAYNDFISELKHSAFGFKVVLRNALMQGKSAPEDIAKAIAELQQKNLDIIVITRGGGSMTDLSCFDSEMIAKAVAASSIPVLSGIGHEIDLTITDLAVHTFAKTPTAIAQFVVGRVEAYVNDLAEKSDHLIDLAESYLKSQSQLLHSQALLLHHVTSRLFKGHHEKIVQYREVLKHKPRMVIKQAKDELKLKREMILKSAQGFLADYRNKLKGYEKMVDIASPVNTMKRGFSVVRGPEGKIIRSKKDIKKNMTITTEVVDGSFESEIR